MGKVAHICKLKYMSALTLIKRVLTYPPFPTNPELTAEENAKEATQSAALLAAVVATEPLPFADMLLTTPLHIRLVIHIGELYGISPSWSRSREVLTEWTATFAYGFLGRQWAKGLVKMASPGVGTAVQAPMAYALTLALGRWTNRYYRSICDGDVPEKNQKQTLEWLSSEALEALTQRLRLKATEKSPRRG